MYNASPLHPANVGKKAWLLLLPATMQWRYYPGASPSLRSHLCTAAVHCSQIHVHICKQWHEQGIGLCIGASDMRKIVACLGALTSCSGCIAALTVAASPALCACHRCSSSSASSVTQTQRQSNLGLASSTPSRPTSVLAIMSIGHGMAAALQQYNLLCCAKNTCSALLPVARTGRGWYRSCAVVDVP